MAWHTRDIDSQCQNYACRKRATVRLYDNFNSNHGVYCAACGKARAIIENKQLDEYNKFHRSGERLTKYKGAKS